MGLLGDVAAYLVEETDVAERLLPRYYLLIVGILCLLLLTAILVILLMNRNARRGAARRSAKAVAPAQPPVMDVDHTVVVRHHPADEGDPTQKVRGNDAPVIKSDPGPSTAGTTVGSFVLREDARPSRIERLVVRYTVPGAQEEQKVFDWPETISIGRLEDNDLVIPYRSVSKKHAQLRCEGDQVWLKNISDFRNGSQNMLFAEDRSIGPEELIESGCRVNMGMVPLLITWTVAEEDDLDRTVRQPMPQGPRS